MNAKKILGAGLALALVTSISARGQDSSVKVVAAENFYGDVARQIGTNLIDVSDIMRNPDQDPHLFETTPAVVRQVSEAQIVILNGADYDQWMVKLLSSAPRSGRIVINVASLVAKKDGDNPHVWYDPGTMPAAARALARSFGSIDPAHATNYRDRLMMFESSLAPVNRKIEQIRVDYGGVAVTATEPVFGYMAAALGLSMHNERFQLSVMNDTEPSARDVAAFEQDLADHKVKVLIYNKQAVTNLTKRMLDTARRAKVPVVGVMETEPPGVKYQDWMLMQLDELQKALGDKSP